MINTKRLVLAYVVTLLVVNLYDFAVFGAALGSYHEAHKNLLRPDPPMVRYFLTGALNLALVTLFYALFARGKASRLSTGVVFGALLGLIAGWIPQAYNKMLLLDWPFYTAWAPAVFGGYLLAGIVLGLAYRE